MSAHGHACDCGKKAVQALGYKIEGAVLRCSPREKDCFGRIARGIMLGAT